MKKFIAILLALSLLMAGFALADGDSAPDWAAYDPLLDRIEQEREKRFDKILNWAWLFIGIGVVAYLVWFFFFR